MLQRTRTVIRQQYFALEKGLTIMTGKEKGIVLVVDDESDIIMVLSEFLKNDGYSAVTARSGIQALGTIREQRIDLVLLDISMPIMNGLDTLRELKKFKPELPVIMITAYRDAEKVIDAVRLGAFDCVFKPFDLTYLRKTIASKLSAIKNE